MSLPSSVSLASTSKEESVLCTVSSLATGAWLPMMMLVSPVSPVSALSPVAPVSAVSPVSPVSP